MGESEEGEGRGGMESEEGEGWGGGNGELGGIEKGRGGLGGWRERRATSGPMLFAGAS